MVPRPVIATRFMKDQPGPEAWTGLGSDEETRSTTLLTVLMLAPMALAFNIKEMLNASSISKTTSIVSIESQLQAGQFSFKGKAARRPSCAQ